ncbi:tRNA (guanosine(46)-N7)-methyltransferase TrmB [Acholeplasma hippikon]|uniref:tRNA (guanine-N(7)-)-methyltransferase n=1 Tax=Acholeplasma hippikon TaxID=264636 RepID=A0A449BJI0_9MOLU|nr:tRNA (guanosine(46)-N7)-methyltransferase TrmB [Acholeplasma hippikon]VEU82621.1 tRNA (guanine-N(7)-)-methyltransferase [Acholeplasma hippikon]
MRQKKIKDATIENLLDLGVWIEAKPISNKVENIFMEIGSGKGQFITSLAKANPDRLFVAVEKEQNVCYRLAQKRAEMELDNLIVIMDDAENLANYFVDSKASVIQLNFSDPWPKSRHHKRRLTYPTKLNLYKQLLSHDGKVILRTDHLELFNDSLEYFIEANYQIIASDLNLPESDFMTEYEVKKRKNGPIYQLEAIVKNE